MHSDRLPKNAEHYLQQAGAQWDELQRQRYLRAGKTWQSLANVKQHLDDGLMSDEPGDELDIATRP
jgi:hypothetical protein